MRQSVRRWVFCAGALATVGAMAFSQSGTASAARSTSTSSGAVAARSAAYVPPSKPIYYGEKGAAVLSVQRRLAQLHYYPGPLDGEFGPDTQEAAWAFREVQGLPMNAATAAEPISSAFLHDLIHPKPPHQLVPNGPPNRIEVNQNIEVLVLYKDDEPNIILHVSSGGGYYYPCPGDSGATCGPAITPDGNYTAYGFSAGWITVPLGTMYNPIWFLPGYAIHGDIPVPWYPASHGCVRIWMDAATWFYKHVSIGGKHPTPVYIRGKAPYYI